MDPSEEKPRKCLKLKPRKTNILGVFRVLSSGDYTRECKDFIESVEAKEDLVERGVVFASMLAQKVLQYMEKPLWLVGSGLEMCLNILCNANNKHLFFNNLLRGKVVVPSKSSTSFVSIIGLVDGRVDLDTNIKPETNKYFAVLSAMASKLAYENHQYIQMIVEKTWKVVGIFGSIEIEFLVAEHLQEHIFKFAIHKHEQSLIS